MTLNTEGSGDSLLVASIGRILAIYIKISYDLHRLCIVYIHMYVYIYIYIYIDLFYALPRALGPATKRRPRLDRAPRPWLYIKRNKEQNKKKKKKEKIIYRERERDVG